MTNKLLQLTKASKQFLSEMDSRFDYEDATKGELKAMNNLRDILQELGPPCNHDCDNCKNCSTK